MLRRSHFLIGVDKSFAPATLRLSFTNQLLILQITMWHMAVWLSIVGGVWRVSSRDSRAWPQIRVRRTTLTVRTT